MYENNYLQTSGYNSPRKPVVVLVTTDLKMTAGRLEAYIEKLKKDNPYFDFCVIDGNYFNIQTITYV